MQQEKNESTPPQIPSGIPFLPLQSEKWAVYKKNVFYTFDSKTEILHCQYSDLAHLYDEGLDRSKLLR